MDKSVSEGEHVAPVKRTIKHNDLKQWMINNYPGDKPSFLFDDVEQKLHNSITKEAYQALRTELEASKVRLQNAEIEINSLNQKKLDIEYENNSLQKIVESMTARNIEINTNAKNSYLKTIAALCSMAKINPAERGVAKNIRITAEQMNQQISDDTILKILNEVSSSLGLIPF